MNLNATLIGQSIAFIVFVWFCKQYVWPMFAAVLEERKQKITDGLAAAAKAEKDLAQAQADTASQLNAAKADAAAIIDQANKRAAQIVDEAKVQAREEGQRIVAGANAEIEQQVNRAREALRAQVAVIAVSGAEKILGDSIDKKANDALLQKLAAEL